MSDESLEGTVTQNTGDQDKAAPDIEENDRLAYKVGELTKNLASVEDRLKAQYDKELQDLTVLKNAGIARVKEMEESNLQLTKRTLAVESSLIPILERLRSLQATLATPRMEWRKKLQEVRRLVDEALRIGEGR